MSDTQQVSTYVTDYVQDPSHWEAWKIEYQFGAFFVFPPADVRAQVNELRQKFDPQSQAYCDAHISLTAPLPRPINQQDFDNLAVAVRTIKPFTIKYGLPTSYPGVPGVVLAIEPFEIFDHVVKSLEACDIFAEAKPRHHPFSPHMTIAEFITLERTEELVKELSPANLVGSFECTALSYAVPDRNFHFTERKFLPLGS